MKLDEIKELISILEESNLSKLELKKGDFEFLIEKPVARSADFHSNISTQPTTQSEIFRNNASVQTESKTTDTSDDNEDTFVTSPMVGTFYTTPSPTDPTFVKVGDVVDEDTVLCVIEAMKVMNEVKAGVKGRVKEILCKTAQPVEFKTNLFRIELL